MAFKHSVQILQHNSRYLGRRCPSTRTELGVGEQIVICHKSDEAFSWNALPVLEGRCPYCDHQIDLGEIFVPSGETYASAKAGKGEESKPKSSPYSAPPPRRGALSFPVVALIALLGLGLIGICTAAIALGYRQFFAQSTASSPAGEASDPTNSPVPTTLRRQVIVSPTPTKPSSEEHDVVDVIRRFNADQTTAMRDLNLDAVRSTCTDRCLVAQREYMEQLVRDNLYEIQEQLDFEVLRVDVSGDTAEVVTSETWRTAKYDRSTQECRYHQPTFVTQQTYTLVREGGTWKISWDNFDTPAPADIPGC